MLDLLHLCEREGIRVFWRRLDEEGNLLGMYFRSPRRHRPIIALDVSLINRVKLARCVLAEEIGHYWCSPTVDHVNVGESAGLEMQALWRDEHRALRMAANLLIPTEALADAVRRGITSADELSEHFLVEEWMVWRKLRVLQEDLREQWRFRVRTADILSPLLAATEWGEAVS
ncbi:MAG: hypothetical protein BAA04_06975 [Firmicutes bacterium ZCTH02-B6]|nr:MAG: hypothetical protein BAA04_06975 [Firmicutes bacterium ZCTH02-B6]